GPTTPTGSEANRVRPSRRDRNRAASWPRTLLPQPSSGGANVASAPLPGETTTIPPPIPLLPGTPTSYSQSPEVSYSPAVVITASAKWQIEASTTGSFVRGFTPPLASVAPMTARSIAVTRRQLSRV